MRYYMFLSKEKGKNYEGILLYQSRTALTYKHEYTESQRAPSVSQATCLLPCGIVEIRKGALLKGKIAVKKNQKLSSRN